MASQEELLQRQSELIAQLKEAHSRDRNRLIKKLNRVQQELDQPQLIYDHRGDVRIKPRSSDNYSFGPQQAEEAIAKKLTEEKGQSTIVQQDGRTYRVFGDGSFVETRSPQAQFSSGSGQINTLPNTPLGGVPVSQLRPETAFETAKRVSEYEQTLAAQGVPQEQRLEEVAKLQSFRDVRVDPATGLAYGLTPGGFQRLPDTAQLEQQRTIIKKVESGTINLSDILPAGRQLPLTPENVRALQEIFAASEANRQAQSEIPQVVPTQQEAAQRFIKSTSPQALVESDYVQLGFAAKDILKSGLSEGITAASKLFRSGDSPLQSVSEAEQRGAFTRLTPKEEQAYQNFVATVGGTAGAGALILAPVAAPFATSVVATLLTPVGVYQARQDIGEALLTPTPGKVFDAVISTGLSALDIAAVKATTTSRFKDFVTPKIVRGTPRETEILVSSELDSIPIQRFNQGDVQTVSAKVTESRSLQDAVIIPFKRTQFGMTTEYEAVFPRSQFSQSSTAFDIGKEIDSGKIAGFVSSDIKGGTAVFAPVVVKKGSLIEGQDNIRIAMKEAKLSDDPILLSKPKSPKSLAELSSDTIISYDTYRTQAELRLREGDEGVFSLKGTAATIGADSFSPQVIGGEIRTPKAIEGEFKVELDASLSVDERVIKQESFDGIVADFTDAGFESSNVRKTAERRVRPSSTEVEITSTDLYQQTATKGTDVFAEGDILTKSYVTSPGKEKGSEFDFEPYEEGFDIVNPFVASSKSQSNQVKRLKAPEVPEVEFQPIVTKRTVGDELDSDLIKLGRSGSQLPQKSMDVSLSSPTKFEEDIFAGDVKFKMEAGPSTPDAEMDFSRKARSIIKPINVPKSKSSFSIENEIVSLDDIEVVPTRKITSKFGAASKLSTGQRINTEFASSFRTDEIVKSQSESALKSLSNIKTEQITRPMQKPVQEVRVNTEFKSAQITELKSLTEIKSMSEFKTVQITTPKTPSIPKTPRIEIPGKPPRGPPRLPELELDFDGERGYNALVKERGKYIKVNKKPQSMMAALSLGQEYVDNTAAKSFKIIPTKGKAQTAESNYMFDDDKLRRPKRGDSKVYIEKNKYAIDTEGERQGITVKGLRARKRKSIFGEFKFK